MSENQEDKPVEMEQALTTTKKDPGFWREVWQQIRLVFRLLGDLDVPVYLKVLPFIPLAYVIMPVDILPDVIPVVGQLDDLTFLLIGLKIFIELAPPDVVAKQMDLIRAKDGYAPVSEMFDESADEVALTDDVSDTIIIDGEHEIIFKEKDPSDLE